MSVEVNEGWITTPDQARLFYRTRGEGQPIIFCNGIGVSANSFWSEIVLPLSHDYQVINWDYRGHGYSDPPHHASSVSIRSCAEDLRYLMHSLGIEKAVVVGHSMGVQVCFEFYRWFPQYVKALIPVLGTYAHPFNDFLRLSQSPVVFRKIYRWVTQNPRLTKMVWPRLLDDMWARPFTNLSSRLFRKWGMAIHPDYCPPEELMYYLAHLKVMCPITFFHLANSMQEHSAEDILETIDVPTLIFAGEKDIFTPVEASYKMKSLIPNAQLEVVKEGSHAAIAEQPEAFWKSMDRFVSSL